jgi:hypothetical protein
MVAGVITLLIFSLGITLGFVIDSKRVAWAEKSGSTSSLDYESLQLQYLYLNTLEGSDKHCEVLSTALSGTLVALSSTIEDIERFKESTHINGREYDFLLRKFTVDNLKYWLFSEKSKKICDMDAVSILYFFSREDCDICPNQGVILSYFKRLFDKDLLIFPIDVDIDEPIIDILKSVYNISSYPSLVIEDNKFDRIVYKQELGEIICDKYKDYGTECSSYVGSSGFNG